jgi:hypothetical protein
VRVAKVATVTNKNGFEQRLRSECSKTNCGWEKN